MKVKEADQIAEKVKELSGLDIFKNTRKQEYVDARSLVVFLLYHTKKFRLSDIERYFKSRGKKYDHCTALYAKDNFNNYRKFNKDLDRWLNILTNKKADIIEKQNMIIEDIKALKEPFLSEVSKIVKENYDKQIKEYEKQV
jgi:hypothetical protein